MQTVLAYLMFIISGIALQAQNTIEVTLTDFKSNDGSVRVGLYDKEGDFLDLEFRTLKSKISDKKAVVTFTDVPDGIYAISCYHYEDDNGELNMILGMIPSESYGCSNGARGFFGPPKWEDAKFDISGGEKRKFDIRL
ncbi:MAG: DUF2141 domain-containing protein [Flavobacteriaceae bacterium]|nr:DUF2141 domain-containing protein [Flavobacteriaceae bacterium]